MFIKVFETPNPETMKFVVGFKLSPQSCSYTKEEYKGGVALLDILFAFPEVESILVMDDFITITKNQLVEWSSLKPLMLTAMVENITEGVPITGSASPAAVDEKKIENEIIKQIREIIETKVQPAVAQDGGSIIYQDFIDGVVYLKLQGACAGCPSATVTLKDGVESMLKHYVPEVLSVEAA